MSLSKVVPQEFRNIAGVGYIQGAVKSQLDARGYPNQVEVDGMYGLNTVHGLNTVTFKVFNRIAKETHLFQGGAFNEQWENAIMSFQRWYGDIYDQLGTEEVKFHKLPAPQNDGDWGPETKKCVDAILAVFDKLHTESLPRNRQMTS